VTVAGDEATTAEGVVVSIEVVEDHLRPERSNRPGPVWRDPDEDA
jgi:hypothetical protein